MTTSMNERTHFFIKKYTSHTLFSKGLRKGWCWLCVRGELETEIDCHILTPSSSDPSSTSSSFCWAAQPWVTEGQGPLSGAGSHSAGILFPTTTGTLTRTPTDYPELSDCNWTDKPKLSVVPGYVIVWRPPASCGRTHLHRIQTRPQVKVIFRHPRPDAPASPFVCLFTQVHLLIDGSVEGQYATLVNINISSKL